MATIFAATSLELDQDKKKELLDELGTTIGTVTDFDGNYTLEVPDDATILVFSYIGLQTQEVAIKSNVINVTLKENSEVLEEVVVTGYGTTKKRDLVTSVASVSADQLKDVPVVSAAEALQGKLAGVSVTTSEGSPDAEVKIRVRGGTSLTQSSDPLYIVDGFPVSSIADIAPSDIASMDVLKDAAATAIYGAQGANGVIIISDEGCKLIAETLQTTANQIPQTAETVTENTENSLLQTTIAVLREQLSEKDKQIAALTSALTTSQEQVKQLTESLHDTTTALAAAQALHAGTIKQQLADKQASHEGQAEERKGFWQRIFKKRS